MFDLFKRIVPILVVVVAVLLAACSQPTPTPTPTPTPEMDDSWTRILQAGKMVVGTSADYPPFEYYTGDFSVDGFDFALMHAIGQRLGVEVEFHDFAFDGLGGALLVGQIDAAIGALSVTPERQALVDFSNVYYVGEDAILANQNSTISAIRSAADMAGQRVGVQRGSVYEDWLRSSLVDTGLMPERNLFSYVQVEDALRDLRDQRLDLVVLDSLPAQAFVNQGGVKLVGRGLNRQRFAIAVRKGATSLKTALDGALTALQNEGVVADLIERYLHLDRSQIPTPELATPTAPPAVTTTPVPAPPCVDGMALVQDLTFDDNHMAAPPALAPGQPFVKGWRVRNTGTCTWKRSYELVYVYGNVPAARMGGTLVPIERDVAPGEQYDIRVSLAAPVTPGVYQGFWQMRNGKDVAFGQRIWVGIRVPAAPTATPAATQTPSPEIQFSANRTRIRAGECAVLRWKVENIREVYLYTQGEDWRKNGVIGEGQRQVCPAGTTTYELRVIHRDNRVEVKQIRIEVEAVVGAPVISRFTVDPPHQITVGQCVDVRWEVQGTVTGIRILRNNGSLWDGAPISGTRQDCPPGAGEMEYAIEASGPGGTSRLNRHVNVVSPATATPEPTPAPEAPAIHAFSVSPNNIQQGESVGVSWSVGGGTTLVQLRRNGEVIQDRAGFSGQVMDIPPEPGNYTYRLEAYGADEQSAFREETVFVAAALPEPPPNPLAGTSWQVTAYFNSSAMASVLEGTNLTVAFDREGNVNGSAGCNTYSATYTVVGQNQLTIYGLTVTGQMCNQPAGIMEQESVFLAALQSATGFNIEGGSLFVQDASSQIVLEMVQLLP